MDERVRQPTGWGRCRDCDTEFRCDPMPIERTWDGHWVQQSDRPCPGCGKRYLRRFSSDPETFTIGREDVGDAKA